jgi:hypothetical protein
MNTHPEAKENPKTARINNEAKQTKTRHMSRATKPPKVGGQLSTTLGTQGGGHMQALPGTLRSAAKQYTNCTPHNRMQMIHHNHRGDCGIIVIYYTVVEGTSICWSILQFRWYHGSTWPSWGDHVGSRGVAV